jgi:transcriptional regulator with XRE-family HTH domain
MSNLLAVLTERIARVARREIRAHTGSVRRAASRHRGDIAGLKRQVQQLGREVARLAKVTGRIQPVPQPATLPEAVRFSPRTVRALRAKLGLTARQFGKLADVAAVTIHSWETGRRRPRPEQLARLVALRGLGRREAHQRLEEMGVAPAGHAGTRQPGAEKLIMAIIGRRKKASTAEINRAWRKAGRPGRADNTLGRMIRTGRLKRLKVAGERGSLYTLA